VVTALAAADGATSVLALRVGFVVGSTLRLMSQSPSMASGGSMGLRAALSLVEAVSRFNGLRLGRLRLSLDGLSSVHVAAVSFIKTLITTVLAKIGKYLFSTIFFFSFLYSTGLFP